MTLKTILKNFLNYADTLEAQKKLGKDIYEIDFQKLKSLTEELKRNKDYTTSEGLKEVNRRKNRYKDILPYDYTRVILSEYPGVPGSDYINANYIKGASGSLAYIASQGPLPNTVVDFWRMIWECEVQVIVMACNEQESGKYKCECYWPTDEEKKQYGNINVEFVKWRQVCPDFLVRTLKACWETEERVLCQFHYTTWPDHGVPTSVQPILELVRLIRDCQASEAVPVLIHCSAGCGRTGTICAIDYVWGLMRMGKLTKNFNLYNVIADMRRQRIAMVQTKEQYVLVHKAVSSLFEQQLRVIDSHTYENLDEDGEPLLLKEMQEEDIYEDILEPPLLDDPFRSSDKHGDGKVHLPNIFPDYSSSGDDVPPVPSKRDPYPENLLNFSKSIVYKPDMNDRSLIDLIDSSGTHNLSSQTENLSLEQNVKDEPEYDLSYTKNSQTLKKLCREESVKRLISGWNKVVEQSDDIKNIKEIHLENVPLPKSHAAKLTSEKVVNHHRSSSAQEKQDQPLSVKHKSTTPNHKASEAATNQKPNETQVKNNSPEEAHAGKLVGKATVIRRPSIAKLKALFEKSPQTNSETNDGGRRRTLFRSHSHYVSNSSRTFTLSDGGSQHNSCNETTSAPENRPERNKTNINNNNSHNVEHSTNCYANPSSQTLPPHDNAAYSQPSSENQTHAHRNHSTSASEYNRENPQMGLDLSMNRSNTSNSQFDSNNSYSSTVVKSKKNAPESHYKSDNYSSTVVRGKKGSSEPRYNSDINYSSTVVRSKKGPSDSHFNSDNNYSSTVVRSKKGGSKKEIPPELPVKKKPLPQPPDSDEKNSKDAEVIVPRFVVNLPKEPVYADISNKSNSSAPPRETPNKNTTQIAAKPNNENVPVKTTVASPEWNSDDSIREFLRRSSQDVDRRVLCKNQSFSDPEQSNRGLDQATKQPAKPKLSLTDQTYPKLAYSVEKSLDEKVNFSYECAYMNVNSLAQKNIRQIEEKIKTHPRGAIIDLTSRKSYIEETPVPPERQYVFRNTVEPVKILPRQESKDLILQEKVTSKPDPSTKESSDKSHNSVTSSKLNSAKADEDDLISKNLLLHSPPPKSKRGHLSKSNSKQSTGASSQDSSDVSDSAKNVSSTEDKTKKVTSPSYATSNVSNISNTSASSTPAADRSDPRYFPVNRQTASDAKYECEKHKAETREAASGRPISTHEPIYSSKPINSVYHKLPLGYEKSNPETKLKEMKYTHDNKSHYDKEPLYGLQRSTSGPQILPPSTDATQKLNLSADINRSYDIYGRIGEDSKVNKPFLPSESRNIPHYDTSQQYAIYGTTGQHNMFPPGPPKPPRTYHYDVKTGQDNTPEVYKSDHTVKRDGGRYIVSVASPKHSNVPNPLPPPPSNDYRYDRVQDISHVPPKPVYQPQPTYVSPLTNEVHMSRSYPFSNYDRNYYPRPYGKQYYPESVQFRNVQPVHVTNSIYGVPEKPIYAHQNIYGTVKHRNTYADYENVYDTQVDYMHSMAKSNPKSDHHIYQSINQYSQADVYGLLPAAKSRDFKNIGDGSMPKRVYFDTLQRRNKQVSWEQRRSHDDMDIRPAPSARLREQIHARRSMVELDNLEISVASDEGYPERAIADTLASPNSHVKIPHLKSERHSEVLQSKSPVDGVEISKEFQKKNYSKEPASFGETLSKAFGKLTSFTKFNTKDGQTGSAGPSDTSNAVPKAGKPKDKNLALQSPSSKEASPPEQWTQV